jgi:DNA-binding NtrC family response regulator
LGNLGLLALCNGNAAKARHYLDQGRKVAGESSFVQLALVDSLANVALYEGNLDECRSHLDEAEVLIRGQNVPARSWYDLAHQITRCLYLDHLRDWPGIVDVVDRAHPELERRQLRVWDTSLLAAKAKAQAHLGLHDEADATLLQALRVCPRGAVDPLITVEAATGTCLVLRGDADRGARHFDRALRACQAISHRFQEWIVTSERDRLVDRGQPPARVDRRRHADTEDTNLILTDVSAMLGAGHSIDVMAQRLAAIIATTALRSRLDVTSDDLRDDDTHAPVDWETGTDGTHRIVLTDSSRRVVLSLRAVHSLEDVSLVRNLVDIAKSAANQAGGPQQQDEELLWPQVSLPSSTGAIFWSPRMQEFLRIAMRLAATELPILITGETGTGKEVVARLIHENSKWARGPFVPFNASALSKDLVESQMFGFRRGAFTGAVEASGGVIRAAEHGTLFLDEIGDLDISLQPKLLRFLESGEVHPLGESRPIQTRVRVVAATNADLRTLVASQRFRSDLFYRLEAATLTLPPLRDRKDEIPALAALYVRKACKESGRQNLNVADDFIAALLLHDWPGNIRQLANEIRRVVALAEDGATVSARNLSPDVAQGWASSHGAAAPRETGPTVTVRVDQPLDRALDDVERAFLERALTQTRGHVSDAARLLGISRKGLFLKRKKLGLD